MLGTRDNRYTTETDEMLLRFCYQYIIPNKYNQHLFPFYIIKVRFQILKSQQENAAKRRL